MKVRIKSGDCPSYLTVGRVYEAYVNKEIREDAFIIGLDNASLMKCYFNNCPRLNCGSWEIVDE